MSNYKILPINDEVLEVGTRIHYDKPTQSLYYVDVPKSTVHRHDLRTGRNVKATVGNEPIAFMFPVEGCSTKFVAGLGRKFVFVEWDGEAKEVSNVDTIAEVDQDGVLAHNRLNGAKIDPWGRLWAGTMGPVGSDGNMIERQGSLYCLEKGQVKQMLSGIGISNGLAWDTNSMKMYYIDTLDPVVYGFDITDCGNISNKRIAFDLKKENIEGLPDGLAIDSDGKLWVTVIHGSVIVQFDPNSGDVLAKIEFPTPQVTSLCFGGEKLEKMYVTTARISINGKTPAFPAGTTYVVKNPGCFGAKINSYIS